MFTSFSVQYQTGYTMAQPWWDQMATLVPSTAELNTYGWMAKLPRLRKWVGERVLTNVAAHAYSLINDDYELTAEVPRNKIQDDSYGVYGPILADIGMSAKKWPDDLLYAVLRAGQTTPCFDGQNFFDPSHPIDMNNTDLGTYANYTASGLPLTPDNYQLARTRMMAFKGEDNKEMGIIPDLLVVPPQLESIGKLILFADLIAASPLAGVASVGGQTNIFKGSAKLLVVPELSIDPGTWYLLCTSRPIKPFVFQQRQAPIFQAFQSPNDLSVFFRKKFVYGVDARGAAGYTLPFLAYKAAA